MADVKLSEVLSSNPAAAPTGPEPIESVQSATSVAFTFAQLSNHPLNPQTGTTYTLVLTDQGKAVTMNNASANTCTIPLNATVAYHIGTLLLVRQIGAGVTTLAATGGVTIEKAAGVSLTMSGVQEQLILHKVATDTWHVVNGGAVKNPDMAVFLQGVLGDSEKLLTFVAQTAFSLPSGLTGTTTYAEVVATAAATIDIQKNAVSIGSINFAIGANTATFTFATLTSFAIGDRLQLVNQGTADTTLADVALTIRGNL